MAKISIERAYELAVSGECASVARIVALLKAEGFPTVLTDLRSRNLRRELHRLCVTGPRADTYACKAARDVESDASQGEAQPGP